MKVIEEAFKIKKYESWEFNRGEGVYLDPNLLTGFFKYTECSETHKYTKHFSIFRRGRSDKLSSASLHSFILPLPYMRDRKKIKYPNNQ